MFCQFSGRTLFDLFQFSGRTSKLFANYMRELLWFVANFSGKLCTYFATFPNFINYAIHKFVDHKFVYQCLIFFILLSIFNFSNGTINNLLQLISSHTERFLNILKRPFYYSLLCCFAN